MTGFHRRAASILALAGTVLLAAGRSSACTGITLRADDGSSVYGRTMEWGAFDLQSRVVIVHRGHGFTGQTPDRKPGKSWSAAYGLVGLDAVGMDVIVDGMNEKGLAAGAFYQPGFAEYPSYDPAQAGSAISPNDVVQHLLSTCATVAEAREAIAKVRVVPVVVAQLGFAPPLHYMVAQPDGKAIVIEYTRGEMKVFDAPLGVITNSPTYDWHEINLRNYINLSPVALPGKRIEDLDFKPLGAGSGMIGLPGDFTPPSRFVRAVAFTQTARPTPTSSESVYELFRILDNFNLPLAPGAHPGMRSSTIWTTGYDLKNLAFYYHTQNDRRLRKVDLRHIDLATPGPLVRFPMDATKSEDVLDVTPTDASATAGAGDR